MNEATPAPAPAATADAATPILAADPAAVDVGLHDEAAWREGLRTGIPTLFGIGAWGLVVGVATVSYTHLTLPTKA